MRKEYANTMKYKEIWGLFCKWSSMRTRPMPTRREHWDDSNDTSNVSFWLQMKKI